MIQSQTGINSNNPKQLVEPFMSVYFGFFFQTRNKLIFYFVLQLSCIKRYVATNITEPCIRKSKKSPPAENQKSVTIFFSEKCTNKFEIN